MLEREREREREKRGREGERSHQQKMKQKFIKSRGVEHSHIRLSDDVGCAKEPHGRWLDGEHIRGAAIS